MRWWRRRLPIASRVLVNLVNERAISGVLLREVGGWVVLADAALHEAALKPQQMDGEVYIECPRIAFIQVAAPKGG